RRTLDAHGITHQAAQNEEFAVSMLIGTQMLDEHPHPEVDGVVGYWYGKGPGLDRSGDALKHANFAGTSRHGAVVILSGEDHEAKSSTVPYQQEFSFERHAAVLAYSRANGLNRVVRSSPGDRIGIVSAGKSWADTLQALEDLGLDTRALEANGIRLAKVGLLCPSDGAFFREFAEGLERVIVVEEKRDFLERQVAAGIVGTSVRELLGKHDSDGARLFPVEGGMTSDMVAERLGRVLARSITLPERGRERVR